MLWFNTIQKLHYIYSGRLVAEPEQSALTPYFGKRVTPRSDRRSRSACIRRIARICRVRRIHRVRRILPIGPFAFTLLSPYFPSDCTISPPLSCTFPTLSISVLVTSVPDAPLPRSRCTKPLGSVLRSFSSYLSQFDCKESASTGKGFDHLRDM